MRFPLEKIDERLKGRILFPLSNHLFNRKGVLRHFRSFRQSEWYPRERLRKIQLKNFRRMIEYADRYIPYYSDKMREIGLTSRDLRDIREIKKFPPLSREELVEHCRDLVDVRFRDSIPVADQPERGIGQPIPFAPFRRHRLIRNTSSGSTGTPTVFYDDGTRSAISWAHELRTKDWYGIEPGAREARMARVSSDYFPGNKEIRLRRHLWNQLVLPGMNLSARQYAYCVREITRFKPRVLWGITSALVGLAEYLLDPDNGERPSIRPELVITWAAPLYDHEKRILDRAFQCPVTNIYGTREVGHVAALCPRGSFHINEENFLVEIEGDGSGEGGGEVGEILVTTLDDAPMPFIRYRVGDLGQLGKADCPCGRKTRVLSKVMGRTGEVFVTRDGRMIAPNFWCRLFMHESIPGAVKRFQVRYREDGNIKIQIVRGRNYSDEVEGVLRGYLAKNFHRDLPIEFVPVDRIEPGSSGKYRMVLWE